MSARLSASPLADPALPTLQTALDPARAAAIFADSTEHHPALRLPLIGIRLVRHKPGRRAVIEYTFGEREQQGRCVLIGKIRRQRSGRSGFELLQQLQRRGFDEHSPDHVSVPTPVAYIKVLRLGLQCKAAGIEATTMLAGPYGVALAQRIAEAAYKLHRADVAPRRRHDMANELRILHARLDEVAAARPAWHARLEQLKRSAARIGMALAPTAVCGIHRDFYADQIIVDGGRLWLLDFDLYCAGDPALDIGNFVGHLTEQALRELGDAAALIEVEHALIEHYAALAGDEVRPAARVYALLTLMRHIYLSTQHPQRRSCTEALLTLCERRAAAELKHCVSVRRGA